MVKPKIPFKFLKGCPKGGVVYIELRIENWELRVENDTHALSEECGGGWYNPYALPLRRRAHGRSVSMVCGIGSEARNLEQIGYFFLICVYFKEFYVYLQFKFIKT